MEGLDGNSPSKDFSDWYRLLGDETVRNAM